MKPKLVPLVAVALSVGMRVFLVLCACLYLIGGNLSAGQSAEIRPALLGNGPRSLINVLDPQRLMRQGQPDAMVNFDFYVNTFGKAGSLLTYGGTPNSDGLSQELINNLERAHFIPAVWHGQPVDAFVAGTLFFATTAGKPHLRIYLNQEREHLQHGDDFISPQQIFPPIKRFRPFDDRDYRLTAGLVAVRVDTDVTGKLLGAKLLREYPPNGGFGEAVMKRIDKVILSPGFLHGRPVACSTTWQIPFIGPKFTNRWL